MEWEFPQIDHVIEDIISWINSILYLSYDKFFNCVDWLQKNSRVFRNSLFYSQSTRLKNLLHDKYNIGLIQYRRKNSEIFDMICIYIFVYFNIHNFILYMFYEISFQKNLSTCYVCVCVCVCASARARARVCIRKSKLIIIILFAINNFLLE